MLQGISITKKNKPPKGNTVKTAPAFAPGAISSFFEIHDTKNGKPIAPLEKMGAVGGGFGLEKGTTQHSQQKTHPKTPSQ